jgi:hypothetical protein
MRPLLCGSNSGLSVSSTIHNGNTDTAPEERASSALSPTHSATSSNSQQPKLFSHKAVNVDAPSTSLKKRFFWNRRKTPSTHVPLRGME